MNARIALLAVALTATAPAFAGDVIADLAEVTGLSKDQVRMIVSNRTPHAEYRTSYGRSLAQFKRALGNERAEQLIAGEAIVLDMPVRRVATIDEGGNQDRTP